MEQIDPVKELKQASKKRKVDPAHMQRMSEAAAEARTQAAAERSEQLALIDKKPPKSAADLAPEALKELAKQLKHKDPRMRRDAMKEIFKLNAQSEDEDPIAEVVYITPAMRDDVDQIEELLQNAVVEKVLDDAAHADDEAPARAVPAFVPMGVA